MAKSARASRIKENHQRFKKNIAGPVEAARLERLSAKLMAIAQAPKPDIEMKEESEATAEQPKESTQTKDDTAMDVDGAKPTLSGVKSGKSIGRKDSRKRRGKKSSIVFPMKGPKRNNLKK